MQGSQSGGSLPGFSSPKKAILLHLKREPGASLSAVALALGTSRTAALRHLAVLESDGFVMRAYQRGRRGRPRATFRLTPHSQRLFPEAYTQLSLHALAFIERGQGREGVVRMLEERAQELRSKHQPRFSGKDLRGRAIELTRIRDQEGYMAGLSQNGRSTFVLVENNCPILAIAQKYGEACEIERRLFRNLLHAEVGVSHRVVAGDPVCRFLVKKVDSLPPP
ncbi:MAG: winged helix-turn-helix transcriptional regulator [Thermoplasmata archaeon]